jgi:GH25 family lysozyme M1 (1,4-beta-N-acetylmuramidase)
MIIKSPPAYDISHWKEVLDFSIISPVPALMITKATEGTFYTDDKFVRFFNGFTQIGVARGCYHFHRKAYDATAQAQYFINVVRGRITNNDLLILDVEEGGETATQLKQWFDVVRDAFPNNKLMIYSRKNILDPIVMTVAQKEFFRAIPVWVAGYPTFPDSWNYPAGYIPDQTKWGEVILWQYSDKGTVTGMQGSVDLNWIEPAFAVSLGAQVTIPPIDLPIGGTTMNGTAKTLASKVKLWSAKLGTATGGYLDANTTFEFTEQSGTWLKLINGNWTNCGSSFQYITVLTQPSAVTPPPVNPPATGKTLTNVISVYSDGSINVAPQ